MYKIWQEMALAPILIAFELRREQLYNVRPLGCIRKFKAN